MGEACSRSDKENNEPWLREVRALDRTKNQTKGQRRPKRRRTKLPELGGGQTKVKISHSHIILQLSYISIHRSQKEYCSRVIRPPSPNMHGPNSTNFGQIQTNTEIIKWQVWKGVMQGWGNQTKLLFWGYVAAAHQSQSVLLIYM